MSATACSFSCKVLVGSRPSLMRASASFVYPDPSRALAFFFFEKKSFLKKRKEERKKEKKGKKEESERRSKG
jgi:hypothetical protein